MTTIDLDAGTARLRIDAGSFELLVAACSEEGLATSADAAGLRAAGVLTEQGPHRSLRPGLSAVLGPTCQLRATVAGAETSLLHQGWVTPSAAALLLEVHQGVYDFVTLPPDLVPVSLARMVRLGPRRVGAREPVLLPDGMIDDLWHEDAGRRREALGLLGGAKGRWAWRAEMVWPTSDGRLEGTWVAAVDGPDGLYLVEGDGGGTLRPSTASEAWGYLVTLLPSDEELAVTTGR